MTSEKEFLPTSCPGPWFGLENSDPNTDTLVKLPDWVWCGKLNYTSLTFHPWELGDLNLILDAGLGEEVERVQVALVHNAGCR